MRELIKERGSVYCNAGAWEKFKALKKLEMKQKQDPDYKRSQALLKAASSGQAREVEILIQKGADVDNEPQDHANSNRRVVSWARKYQARCPF